MHRKWEKSTCSRRNWVIEGFRQEFLTPFPCPPDNLRSTLHLYYRGSRRGDKSVDRKYRENSSELNRFVGRKKEKKGVGMDISFPELRQCRLNTLFYRKLCDIHTFLIDTNFSNLPFLFFTRHDISWTEFPFFLFSLSILIKIEHLSRRNPRNSIVSRIPRPKIIILQSTSNNSNHRSARYLNKIPKRLHSSFSSPK